MNHFIEPYHSNWKAEFESLKAVFLKTLHGLEIDIQHIGSTAIPGLFAKPILDIDIIINDERLLDEVSDRLETLGYINRGEQGISGRFTFRQRTEWTPQTEDNKKWQEHHLYVCYSDSLALKNHLLFRDALLGDKKLATEYATLKLSLSREKGMTKEIYTRQKTDFIVSVLTNIGLDDKAINEIKKANR